MPPTCPQNLVTPTTQAPFRVFSILDDEEQTLYFREHYVRDAEAAAEIKQFEIKVYSSPRERAEDTRLTLAASHE